MSTLKYRRSVKPKKTKKSKSSKQEKDINSSKNIKISLYHAKWCGHCIDFHPTWKRLTKDIDSYNRLENNNKIQYVEYEESTNRDIMKQDNISGYPTIRITKFDNTEDYMGPRDYDSLADVLGLKLNNIQGGGKVKKIKKDKSKKKSKKSKKSKKKLYK